MLKKLLGFTLVAVSLGCQTVGVSEPRAALSRFPIGIYCVDNPKYLAQLKKDGFDSFQTYRSEPELLSQLAREARRQGLRMVASPEKLLGLDPLFTRGWPVDAWYLQDEPDVARTPAQALASVAGKTKEWDPARLQTFVVGQGSAAASYSAIGDILMLDWYPVPHLALDSVADEIDLARQAIPSSKPLWMVVQAFDWREHAQKDPKKPRIGRFPDHSEIRFMSYLAIAHGAKGLFYFTLAKPGGKTLFDFPEQMQALTRVSREIKALQPILERGHPARLPFVPDPDGIEARAWSFRGRDYVVIVNRNVRLALRVPDTLLASEWRPLFETRRDARELLEKRGDAWHLPPRRVMVFERRSHWFN